MTALRPDFPRYPVWPTILIMTLLALVGAFVWWTMTFAGNVAVISASGPFAWMTLGPAVMAAYGAAATFGVFVLPLWAIGGGQLFAMRASGGTGSAARQMGVTFFSETHPIAKATQLLAERMGLPPIAYIGWFPNEEINAFAMGERKSNALVAVSKGAVERLTKQQLIAVLAHELGHVASNDMARMTNARSVQDALTFFLIFRGLRNFARWVFTPLSELELLRLSRAREFTADHIAAMVYKPEHMISALERLKEETIRPKTKGYANVMMWAGFNAGGLFSTHPRIEDRIARLETFTNATGLAKGG